MAEARGKFLYDMVVAQVAGQAADVAALTGRAKDLIGIATISTTITGALANDKLVTVTKGEMNPIALILLVLGFASVFIAGLVVLRPRNWSFVPDAEKVAASAVGAHPSWPVDAYYAQVAMGYLTAGVVSQTNTAIQQNAENIEGLMRGVYVQIAGLGLLATAGLILAAQAL